MPLVLVPMQDRRVERALSHAPVTGVDRPVDLMTRRRVVDAAIRAVAGAPVRHLPAALLVALQGSWGTPEELLGAAPAGVALAR